MGKVHFAQKEVVCKCFLLIIFVQFLARQETVFFMCLRVFLLDLFQEYLIYSNYAEYL